LEGAKNPLLFPLKRLFDRDPLTGVTEIFHYDNLTGDSHIETIQDVEPILDQNAEHRNDDEYTKNGIKNEMWHFARIPIVVQLRWLTEYGIEDWPMHPRNSKLLFRLLNSPEWKYLKATNKIHLGS
jgi:hypothetical protein